MAGRHLVDQMGVHIELKSAPQRIVSLVPSQTELLYDLGLEDRVVGITKFCVHPDHWRKTKKIIGGTKKFDIDTIRSLQPDLILGNKEENYQEGIAELKKEFPVWMSDIAGLEQALEMIAEVSNLTDTIAKGTEIVAAIRSEFNKLEPLPKLATLYLMWRDPLMGAASGTFIDSMLRMTGLVNVLSKHYRYPELSAETVRNLNPSLILLSSEPFPFSEKHVPEIKDILPLAEIRFVDGEMFSWYGSRLLLAPAYFNSIKI